MIVGWAQNIAVSSRIANDVLLLDRPTGRATYDDFTWSERQAMFDLFLRPWEMERD